MDRRAVIFTFFILTTNSIQLRYQLHEFMTDNEIRVVFQTTRDSVPLYDVVPVIHTLYKKNVAIPKVRLQVFNNDMVLHLRPAKGFTFGEHIPIYTVEGDKSSRHEFHYSKYSEYGLYHIHGNEEKNMAAIIIRHGKNNNYIFDGTIGENLIIRSLPQRLINDMSKNLSLHELCSFPDSENVSGIHKLTNYHVVIKTDLPYQRFRYSPKITAIENPVRIDSKPSKRNEPKEHNGDTGTVYPEILVILDYNTFNYFRSDISEIVMYLVAFWNGVDLRYRSLNDPRIRLKLAMVVIALDEEATPYLNKYRVHDDAVNTKALKAMGQYLYAEEIFDRSSYDIAIAITRLEICQWSEEKSDSSDCVPLRGISKFGSACSWSDTDKIFEGIALVHDKGFNGIATAAHELGHILGVPHDGSTSANYVGGPGATKCNWEDGYLMSSDRFDGNAFRWSSCSLECFKYFLQQSSAECLCNKPKSAITLPRILPGKMLSLDEQCVEAGGIDACYHDQGACILLYCTRKNSSDECFGTAPAADGSPCGDEKICIGGECIDELQWESA